MLRIARALQLTTCVLACTAITGCAMSGSGADTRASQTRRYFIAADEVDWDYAPSGIDQVTGKPFEGWSKRYMEPAPGRIGRVWHKAIYREYTDSTFTALKPRAKEWEHLGMLGPLIRAEVGDTIKVLFKNNSSFSASMHPHGVFYTKSSEGAPYNDNTSGADKADDGVQHGATHEYVWAVPERAGPTMHEGKSAFWMYHSHVNELDDMAAGLMGPIIITARGGSRADGTPTDTDREVVVAFLEEDESNSPYFDANYAKYAKPVPKMPTMPKDSVFGILVRGGTTESAFRETMNGFQYGNLNGLTMKVGERVRWYIMGTTNFEVHAAHWHGNVVVVNNMRTDLTSITTMEMAIADMVPDNVGTWLFHCHVSDHVRMGMEALYTVLPAK